jgi:hypothetical protein
LRQLAQPKEAEHAALAVAAKGHALHCLVLDGVYRRTEGEPVFQAARAPSRDALAALLEKIIARLLKMLTRLGHLIEEQGMT